MEVTARTQLKLTKLCVLLVSSRIFPYFLLDELEKNRINNGQYIFAKKCVIHKYFKAILYIKSKEFYIISYKNTENEQPYKSKIGIAWTGKY